MPLLGIRVTTHPEFGVLTLDGDRVGRLLLEAVSLLSDSGKLGEILPVWVQSWGCLRNPTQECSMSLEIILARGHRGQTAYELRAYQHMSWKDIVSLMQAESDSAVIHLARKYAHKVGLAWPVDLPKPDPVPEPVRVNFVELRQKRAYEMRRLGKSWDEIASLCEYSTSNHANAGAKKYAGRGGLPWPVQK